MATGKFSNTGPPSASAFDEAAFDNAAGFIWKDWTKTKPSSTRNKRSKKKSIAFMQIQQSSKKSKAQSWNLD
jgi:hypothetical protein